MPSAENPKNVNGVSEAPAFFRNSGLDLLRIFCCICIIALHDSGLIVQHIKYWSLINAFVRPSLWVFFMLSGYFLLEKPVKSIAEFYVLRLSKLIIPLIFYSFIYQGLWDLRALHSPYQFFGKLSLISIVSGTVPQAAHFWFVYSLIGLYILTPFLNESFKKMSDGTLKTFLAVLFVFVTVPMYLQSIFHIKINIDILVGTVQFFYYVLGYAILRFRIYRHKAVIYAAGIANFIVTYFFNFIPSLSTNLYTSSVNMAIAAVFYFVLFYHISGFFKKSGSIAQKIILLFSKSTYGIYLIHIYVLRHLNGTPFTFTAYNYRVQIFINVFAIFIVSFIITELVDNIAVNPLNHLIKYALRIGGRRREGPPVT
jgi:surface polysaccharide O-acyltransferase-like enzyme